MSTMQHKFPTGSNVTLVVTPPSKKKLCDAYVLAFPLGFLGLHHFYLRRYGFGVLYFFTFGLLGVGMVIDWFRLPHLVKQANKKIENPDAPEKKDLSDAYVLWFPFGFLGFHHFYLERYIWGVAYFCTFGLFGIGWLIDACRMKHLVDTTNVKLAEKHAAGPKLKNLTDAYVLTLVPITGLLGGQHYYLGRYGFGVLYTFTLGLLGVGWLVDIFRMSCLVKHVNKVILEGDVGKKRLDDAYILCFPFGFLGLHHFYLRRYVWGTLYFFTFGLLGVGWLIDWFRLPCLVADCNKREVEAQMITKAIVRQPSYNGQATPNVINTHSVEPGTYHLPAYPPQQPQAAGYPQGGYPPQQPQAGGYPAGLYPQVPPYPGYPAVNTNDSSWTTITSSEVGQREMGSMIEEPPSYKDATTQQGQQAAEDSGGQNNPNAPPLPEKEEP